jgi:hypothetical protein
MNTHLEEVVKDIKETISDMQYYNDNNLTYSDVELIAKKYVIAHIKYLESEADRWLKKLEDCIKHPLLDNDENVLGINELINKNIQAEISHKQQELLQAKALLK